MANLSGVYTDLKRASGSASRIYDVIDQPITMPLSSAQATDFYRDEEGRYPGSFDCSRSGGVLVDWRNDASHNLIKNSFQPHLQATFTNTAAEGVAIEFKNVNFSYPARKRAILQDFNLEIKAGDHVSIVGTSGSGKSTIGSLLARLYDVDKGVLCIEIIFFSAYSFTPLKLQLCTARKFWWMVLT